jgi:hypothetical protein
MTVRMYNSNPQHILAGPSYGSVHVLQPYAGEGYGGYGGYYGNPLDTVADVGMRIPGVSWVSDKMPDAIPEGLKALISLGLLLGVAGVAYGVAVKGKSIKGALKGVPVLGRVFKKNGIFTAAISNPKRKKRRGRKRRRNGKRKFASARRGRKNRRNRNRRNR